MRIATTLMAGLVALLFWASATRPSAPQNVVTDLMTKELADIPGKEALMLTVVYPPGGSEPVHRHNAHAFIYVLEGSAVMQLKGGRQVTLTSGQTFYEGPDDVHLVGRSASDSRPAKLLVLMVKNQGAPPVVPVSP